MWLWGPGYTSGFCFLGLWPEVESVCLGSGVSYGVASRPELVFVVDVGAALALGSDVWNLVSRVPC